MTGLWLHRYAKLVAACTLLLIAAGGMVTSTGSGLSVPDWPTTYGWNMFTFPISKWVGGIRYEHTHRLIATTVGMMTIVLAVWTSVGFPHVVGTLADGVFADHLSGVGWFRFGGHCHSPSHGARPGWRANPIADGRSLAARHRLAKGARCR